MVEGFAVHGVSIGLLNGKPTNMVGMLVRLVLYNISLYNVLYHIQ